ncbi:MAG: hypothetical protein MJ214_01610 [Bacilli bacterium]|nr:hypothetical protein [Bacilli bacterium]
MFKEKETLLQNMAFMGIMAALNVLLSALGAYVPIAGIFVMIFLPFFSAITAMICKWRYYPIYAFATIIVSLCATFWHTEFTIFYLIPSVIAGFLFGLCFKLKLNATYSLLFTSLVQLGLTYLAIPIIEAIYGTNLIDAFLTLLQLKDNPNALIIVPSFIYLLSLAQMLLSYIVLHNEIKKFMNEETLKNGLVIKLTGLGLAIFVIPFAFFYVNLSYLFMFVSLFLTVSVFIDLIFTKNKVVIIISSILFSLGFVFVFAFYSLIKMPYAFLLINTSNILLLTFSLLYNLRREKKVC